jgi:glycosyltransferase involved in cell wall biosynthesis
MDLTFIIPTYNGSARLPETLAHLSEQINAEGHTWEVLVVDNASTDDTAGVARSWAGRFPVRCEVIAEPTPGQRHAIHRGLREARGRYFTLVDDDNHLCPEWLDVAVRFLDEHPKAGLIGGKIEPAFEQGAVIPPDFETRYKGFLALRDYGNDSREGVYPVGAGMTGRTFLMRAMYERVQGLQAGRVGNELGSSEDIEKAQMVSHLGWEAWYVPKLYMRHWIPQARLTEDYIDRMWLGMVVGMPWMGILGRLGPCEAGEIMQAATADRRHLRREQVLCWLPAWLHPRVKRARFWREFYRRQVRAYEELAVRSDDVRRVIESIRNAPSELRPPARQTVGSA